MGGDFWEIWASWEAGGGWGLLVCRLFMYVYQNIPRESDTGWSPGGGEQDMNFQDLMKGD